MTVPRVRRRVVTRSVAFRRALWFACALAVMVATAGCGGGHHTAVSTAATVPPGVPAAPGGTIDVYASLPLRGPDAASGRAIRRGMEVALAQDGGRAGELKVNLVSLNDAGGGSSGAWSPDATANNARMAAENPRTVLYLGEFESAASEISIPILNQAGIAELSPSNTYVGLTTAEPGSQPGEPQRFYPIGRRTFLRIAPRDTIQAEADLGVLARARCGRVAIANDRGSYGSAFAAELESVKGSADVNIVSNTGVDIARLAAVRLYAQGLRTAGVGCVIVAGTPSSGIVSLIDELEAAIPRVRLLAPEDLCTPQVTDADDSGISPAAAAAFECTMVPQTLSAYPGGVQFADAFRRRYGTSTPDRWAIYGYEAMSLGLDTIASLGPSGADRSAVLASLFATRGRHSVIGTYGFDAEGDTTLTTFGLYGVGRDGAPAFLRTVSG